MKADTVTDSVRGWLMAAAEWGNEGLTWGAIEDGLEDGTYHLLTNDTAAALLEPYVQADGKVIVCVLLAGGKLEGVERLVEQSEAIARHNKAARVVVVGREGWRSLARKIGYRVDAVHYSKDL